MLYRLAFQDPSADQPCYLYEEVIRELEQPYVVHFDGMFAFASAAGVESLLQDPDFDRFLTRGRTCSLVVGLDAVTNEATLNLLDSLCERHPGLHVRVFHNDVADLFHPKLSRFVHADGGVTLVVGSGNLTPGGLRRNIEAYTVAVMDAQEIGTTAEVDALDEFMDRHAARIRVIDEEGRARARANVYRGRRRGRGAPLDEAEVAEAEAAAEEISEAPPGEVPTQRMMLAEVPRAGGRWHQVHFNRQAIEDYFRARANSTDRVFLYEVQPDGSLGPVEARKVVFSAANVNHKVEISAHRGAAYPTAGPPILVLREIGTRMHRYVMLLPGEVGYVEARAVLYSLPSIGRGAQRVITTADVVGGAWPDCPV